MPLAEVQLSLCQLPENTQSLSKFLQISLVLNMIHTNKIQSKYHLHCSLDYGFHHFCVQVSPLKFWTQFSPERIPSEDHFKNCLLLIHELQYTRTLGMLYGWNISWPLRTIYHIKKLITIFIDINPCSPWNSWGITFWGSYNLMLHQNLNNRQAPAVQSNYRKT